MNSIAKKFPPEVETAVLGWLELRDQGGFSGAKEEEFLAWLDADPQHLDAFEAYEPIWSQLDRMKTPRILPAVAAVAAPHPRIRAPLLWAGGLAVAVAVLIGLFLDQDHPAFSPLPRPSEAVTTAGETKILHLSDGSLVRVAPSSAVVADYTGKERRLRLASGSAHFSVAKNPSRPFVVSAGVVAVRAVGTAFDVSLNAQSIEVAVTEGRVRVDDAAKGTTLLPTGTKVVAAFAGPVLEAGQKVIIDTIGARPLTATAILGLAAPALDEMLSFDGTPLSEVVAEFNARNRHQLVIADDRLQAQAFTGKFRADSYEALTRLLRTSFGVTVEEEGNRTILRLRDPGP